MRGAGYGIMRGYMLFPSILFTIILIIALIYIVFRIINYAYSDQFRKKSVNSSKSENTSSIAIEILNERYAKGEITEEEYKAKKDFISKQQ